MARHKNAYDECWETGQYEDQDCMQCPHYTECSASGYNEEWEDDESE